MPGLVAPGASGGRTTPHSPCRATPGLVADEVTRQWSVLRAPSERIASVPSETARFGVIVPAKPPAFAKSRLGRLGDDVRRSLAAAFAADTVEAAMRAELVAPVLAATDDHRLAARLRALR